jgi:hypothetical protein
VAGGLPPEYHTLILLSSNELRALRLALDRAVATVPRDDFMLRFNMLPNEAYDLVEKLAKTEKVANHHRYK